MALAPQTLSLPARRGVRLLAGAEWWHLLSLDAPTVATLWAWSFARVLHVTLTPDCLLLLFLGTWLLYVSDRILDGFHRDSARLRERHFFYMRHRAAAIRVAIPVSVLLAWLVCAHMLPSARRADLLIFAVALAYFCLVHLRGAEIERWFPKELIVALVFAAATAVLTWSRIEEDRVELALLAALFAALCWLNCIAIEKWERTSRSAPKIDTLTRWGQHHLRLLSAAITAVALFAGVLLLHAASIPSASLCLAAALSAALFIALDRSSFSAYHLRIAADAALLTPLLVLFLR